jgi:hypothetical protein
MYERAMTFTEYVGFYQLARSEGQVLRYLADAYKALKQTVPPNAQTEELADLTEWLGELVRQVDSSLLDEWSQLVNPTDAATGEEAPPAVTANSRAFRVLVRNALFHRVQLAAQERYAELGELDGESGWTAEAWRAALEPYYQLHDEIGTGSDARGPGLLMIDEQPDRWVVRQVFDDPAGDHDWGIAAEVDMVESDRAGEACIHTTFVGELVNS